MEFLGELYRYISGMTGLQEVYVIAWLLGLILPLLNIVLGGITEALHIDFDWDLDGTAVSDFIPLRPMCILTFLLVFGGVGLASTYTMKWEVGLVLALVLGYLAAVIINKCILVPMRKSNCKALVYKDLIEKLGVVTVTIEANQIGEIYVKTKTGGLNLMAALKEGEENSVKTGNKVKVISIREEDNVAIVEETE